MDVEEGGDEIAVLCVDLLRDIDQLDEISERLEFDSIYRRDLPRRKLYILVEGGRVDPQGSSLSFAK